MARQHASGDAPAPALPSSTSVQDGSGLGPSVADLLRAIDWDFADADTRRSRHGLHPYPAKFVPQIPETLIRLLTYPGELVLDCFGGSGTTAVEALRAGRRAISIDANPIGTLITRVKTTHLSAVAKEELFALTSRVEPCLFGVDDLSAQGKDAWRPTIPNVNRWYAPHVVDELAGLRSLIEKTLVDQAARDVGLLAFVTAAARVSYQDSETRYKSVPRPIVSGESSERFLSELRRLIRSLEQERVEQDRLMLIQGDAREQSTYTVDANTVDLVVTSPPYPNSYDYHLYHRFRIYWLGDVPHELRRTEIGSHLTNQTIADAEGKYERDMLAVLNNVANVLRPGRFAAFVVGDGIYRGKTYATAAALSSLSSLVGLDTVACINRRLPAQRRSVTVAGRRLGEESLLILRKADPAASLALPEPAYELFPYERQLAQREVDTLSRETEVTSLRHVGQAAFSYQVRSGKPYVPALQRLSEYDPNRGPKKNSTYASHGLHRYKGKFYPQLAKALINITDPYGRIGLVCDPFGGSGTVAVEARLAGLDVLTIDQNPVAVAIAKAKVDFLDLTCDELQAAVTNVVNGLDDTDSSSPDWSQFAVEVRREIESWFAPQILAKLSHLLRQIRQQANIRPAYGTLVESVLSAVASDLIREISDQEPTDLRIRRRFEPLTDAPVSVLFAERAQRLIRRRHLIEHRLTLGPSLGRARIVQADAATPQAYETEPGKPADIACVVSSPPYGIALPYIDTDRLSLAAIYGFDQQARKQLEERLIGSREINSRRQLSYWDISSSDFSADLPLGTVEFLDSLGKAVTADPLAGFRKKQTPAVLTRYFVSMSRVFKQLNLRLVPGAELALVLGDSVTTIAGSRILIPTVDEICAIAKHRGLALVERIPITVTRENLLNSRHAIRHNDIMRFRKE
jgi:DNA modification methylase